jgi:di/tricarboxylate transporter
MAMGRTAAISATTASLPHKLGSFLPTGTSIGVVLGPLVGLVIWGLPLTLNPAAHRAFAIVGFLLVYWMTETMEHGITALIGCLLFWFLQVAPPEIAFSGFTSPAAWFLFGALLIGQAATQTGLAKRLGYYVMARVGNSYTRLLLGFTLLVCALNLLLSPTAQIATLAPVAMGIVAAWGILAKQTGMHVLWSQWGLAFLPMFLLTIVVSWLTIRWLYPADPETRPPDQSALHDMVRALGPWSRNEQKVLGCLLLAVVLWATDFLHHVNPAAIGIGIGVFLTLPRIGVLDAKAGAVCGRRPQYGQCAHGHPCLGRPDGFPGHLARGAAVRGLARHTDAVLGWLSLSFPGRQRNDHGQHVVARLAPRGDRTGL